MNISADKSRYSDAQLDALADANAEKVTTSTVMNQVAKDSGVAQAAIRGDDMTYREKKESFDHLSHNAASVVGLGAKAVEGAEIAAVHVAGLEVAAIAAPVIAGAAMTYEVMEANVRGKELGRALTRDELHVAMLTQLDMPEGARAEQLAKYPDSGKGWQSGTQKMAGAMIGKDHALMAIVQLHCDQGMNAARDAIDSGDVQRYVASHANVSARMAEDPAFKAGFDAMRWAKDQRDGGAAYKSLVDDVARRDARYDVHHVAWRV